MRFRCTESVVSGGERIVTLEQIAETPPSLLWFGTIDVTGERAKAFKPGKVYQLTLSLQEVLEAP